jgi:hypothetical protein
MFAKKDPLIESPKHQSPNKMSWGLLFNSKKIGVIRQSIHKTDGLFLVSTIA